MTTATEEKIYVRLNTIDTHLAVVAAACKDCRPVVMGNGGRDGINARINSLEEAHKGRGLWFWILVQAGLTLAITIVSSTVVAVALLSLGK